MFSTALLLAIFIYLVSATCMPGVLHVLLALISSFLFIFNDPSSKAVAGSTGPIFTKCSPYGRYL